jgi:hypothetical protein
LLRFELSFCTKKVPEEKDLEMRGEL